MIVPPLLMAYARLTGPAGSRFMRMIIDTGANTTLIPPEAARAIGCDLESGERAPMATASGVLDLLCLRIPEIGCLGENVHGLDVLCHSLPTESSAQGVLGLDFLRHVPAYREFEKKILELARS